MTSYMIVLILYISRKIWSK